MVSIIYNKKVIVEEKHPRASGQNRGGELLRSHKRLACRLFDHKRAACGYVLSASSKFRGNLLMREKQIEAILASPPEREELVVQLLLKDGGQWAEIFRENGRFLIELYPQSSGHPWAFDADEVRQVIDLSIKGLKNRLQSG